MKATLVRRLYGASTASTNDLAHIDVVSDAVIVGIDWSISTVSFATGDRVAAEISTSSVCQGTSNDCGGVISNCDLACGVVGAPAAMVNKFVGPTGIFVPRGTRIFLSTLQAGTSSTQIRINLHMVAL
jgi:hypothetical protein